MPQDSARSAFDRRSRRLARRVEGGSLGLAAASTAGCRSTPCRHARSSSLSCSRSASKAATRSPSSAVAAARRLGCVEGGVGLGSQHRRPRRLGPRRPLRRHPSWPRHRRRPAGCRTCRRRSRSVRRAPRSRSAPRAAGQGDRRAPRTAARGVDATASSVEATSARWLSLSCRPVRLDGRRRSPRESVPAESDARHESALAPAPPVWASRNSSPRLTTSSTRSARCVASRLTAHADTDGFVNLAKSAAASVCAGCLQFPDTGTSQLDEILRRAGVQTSRQLVGVDGVGHDSTLTDQPDEHARQNAR